MKERDVLECAVGCHSSIEHARMPHSHLFAEAVLCVCVRV